MRKIIISESQLEVLRKLVKEDAPLLDNGSVKEYGNPSEIGTSCTVDDADGNPKRGKDVYSDEVGKTTAYQGYFGSRRGKAY